MINPFAGDITNPFAVNVDVREVWQLLKPIEKRKRDEEKKNEGCYVPDYIYNDLLREYLVIK
jgi:hypothetical protein